ncbi:hypothetical protein HLH34_13060 [Gluconacetobacter azotocaptans]|uniref:DUF2125 domain-containing protein n=1 Tax=Gluconacetobacter azotocaptans TaxID=142834 RepID=A0A7W4JU71_9PROT|nr:hypothetical protein [Gluconacetobacter azotocaptans]MBB2190880.1 hypothetical protein [Gluconacetobacter azotocaptans]MBM9401763.1 hypothetical protein [Gluconacetobacter azotocaptans]
MRILSPAVVLAAAVAIFPSARAAPLPADCAVAGADSPAGGGSAATAHGYRLRFSGGMAPPSLHAATVSVKGGEAATPGRDILDAASVVLLGALTNHHAPGCTPGYFADTVRPVLRGLGADRSYDLAWSNPTIVNGSTRISFRAIHLHLTGAGPDMPVVASLDIQDAATDGQADLSSLLPQQARSVFSIPARSLGPLLAAISGRPTQGVAVPVTIRSLSAQRSDMRLDGSGSAVLTGNPDAASASGHMSMRNLPDLIAAVRAMGQTRVATALILANLVGHHADADDTSWDVAWQGGILTVNRIPLPLR